MIISVREIKKGNDKKYSSFNRFPPTADRIHTTISVSLHVAKFKK